MTPRVGIYCRISLDDEGDGLGVARQEADARKLCDRHGWDIAHVYCDNNLSAYKTNIVRPAFNQMIADLKSGTIDGVAAYDLDRLARQPRDIERLIEIYEGSSLAFATTTNDINLSSSDGIFMARMMVNIANKSSSDSSRRIKRKNQERWENGLPHGSRRPYGYNDDQMTLHPVEGPVFQEVGRKFLSGWSYKELAYWMNENGYRTTLNKMFYPITIANMLKKERYGGVRSRDGVTRPGIWEPLFSFEDWTLIQHKIAERKMKAGNKPVAKSYMLTGLLVCGECGTYLNGQTVRDHDPRRPLRRTYHCRVQGDTERRYGCGKVSRDALSLEHFIREAVVFRLDTPDLGGLLAKDETSGEKLKHVLAQVAAKEQRKTGLLNDYVDGVLSKPDYIVAKQRVDSQLGELQALTDEIKRSVFHVDLRPGETVREAWIDRPNGWRQELMSILIEKIVVNYGKSKPFYMVDGTRRRFDPRLIRIDWKI